MLAELIAYFDYFGRAGLEDNHLETEFASSDRLLDAARKVLRNVPEKGQPSHRNVRQVLEALLGGTPVRSAATLGYDCRYPEVRLYFAGLIMTDHPTGSAVLRPAFRGLAQRLITEEL